MIQASTIKVGTGGEMAEISRSGFSTNVFIVVITSQWEQNLDLRQGCWIGSSLRFCMPQT